MNQTIKPGDIFVTSWGYDQTNYDFVVVTNVSPTGKTITCQRAQHQRVGGDMTTDQLKPTPKGYGLPFRLKVKKRNDPYHFGYGQVWLRGSYPFLGRYEESWTDEQKQNWLSSKRLDTFNPVDKTRSYGQTNPMFGH